MEAYFVNIDQFLAVSEGILWQYHAGPGIPTAPKAYFDNIMLFLAVSGGILGQYHRVPDRPKGIP